MHASMHLPVNTNFVFMQARASISLACHGNEVKTKQSLQACMGLPEANNNVCGTVHILQITVLLCPAHGTITGTYSQYNLCRNLRHTVKQ